MPDSLVFPEGFLWGAATSSHQVEGGQNNDWSEWEKQGKTTDGLSSGLACDHWNRYAEDFDLAKKLDQSAHRFSLEWSRIEPIKGEWDETAIDHYRQVVQALQARQLEPFVTLWHFTSPQWFMQHGGWESPDAPMLFARFAEKMAIALPGVRFWLTLNEPNVYSILSYLIGVWPPEVASSKRAWTVYRHLIAGHNQAAVAMKRVQPNLQIGSAHNMFAFEPKNHASILDRLATSQAHAWYNQHWLKRTVAMSDFIGVNHYTRQSVAFQSVRRPIVPEFTGSHLTDFDWDQYPEGMYRVLKTAGKFGLPMYITENGLADRRDQWRRTFIRDYLTEVHRAIADGINVRGYFHWSLLDNFEWREGFTKRFGLIEVDFTTQQRTIRPSAEYYADICRTHRVVPESNA